MISRLRKVNFAVDDLSICTFNYIGQEHKNPSVTHTVWLKKECYGMSVNESSTDKLSGYASYSVLCSDIGVIGVVFKTFKPCTVIDEQRLSVHRPCTLAMFTPNYQLERLGLFAYVADNGSVVVIPVSTEISSFMVGV